MRGAFLTIVVLGIAAVLAWEFVLPVRQVDGGYDLTVHVSTPVGTLRYVSCQAFGRREQTEEVLEYLLPPETRLFSAVAAPFLGKPLKVFVPLVIYESHSGRDLKRSQFRYLVVIGEWQDGRRVGKLVEIPDGRLSREVSVVLP